MIRKGKPLESIPIWKGKSVLTWKDIELLVEVLSKKIMKSGFEFDKIATVSRGGLVPARLIADSFNIKKILVDPRKIQQKTIFVDDIFDSGDTFKKIIPIIKKPNAFVYASLIARKKSLYPKQLIYAKQTKGLEYVIFPWDKLEYERTRKPSKD